MDKQTIEIRWHGRGGQGAKTACLLLADAAFASGNEGAFDADDTAPEPPVPAEA